MGRDKDDGPCGDALGECGAECRQRETAFGGKENMTTSTTSLARGCSLLLALTWSANTLRRLKHRRDFQSL
jgi:hypothetical protein